MNKWHAALLAVLAAGALAYFFFTAPKAGQEPAAPTTWATGAAQTKAPVATTSVQATTAATPRQETASPAPPSAPRPRQLDSRSYEINYTMTLTVAVGSVAIYMRGWSLEGVGPLGNYSVGELAFDLPPHGPQRLVFKGATEGGVMYVVNCVGAQCESSVEPANYTLLAMFRGGARREAGDCAHLGYQGVLVEEEGPIPAEALAMLLTGISANGTGYYSVKSCLVDGVPLTTSGEAKLDVTLYGQRLTITVKIDASAVSAAPYDAERYRALLAEAKSAQRSGA